MDTSSHSVDNAGVFGAIRFFADPKLTPAQARQAGWVMLALRSVMLLRALLVLYFLFMVADAVASAVLGRPIGRAGQ